MKILYYVTRLIFIYGDYNYINQQSIGLLCKLDPLLLINDLFYLSSQGKTFYKPDLANPTSTLFFDSESRKYMTVHAACTCEY